MNPKSIRQNFRDAAYDMVRKCGWEMQDFHDYINRPDFAQYFNDNVRASIDPESNMRYEISRNVDYSGWTQQDLLAFFSVKRIRNFKTKALEAERRFQAAWHKEHLRVLKHMAESVNCPVVDMERLYKRVLDLIRNEAMATIEELRATMQREHPDKGGNVEVFIEAKEKLNRMRKGG